MSEPSPSVAPAPAPPAVVAPAPPRRRSWITKLKRLATAVLALVLFGLAWGFVNAWTSVKRARTKLAVRVEYPGRKGQAEFLYGPYAGADEELRGHDTSIWLEPSLLAKTGSLRSFYDALVQLEDRDVETGLGVNPRGLGRAIVTRGASGGSSLHDQACDAMEQGFERSLVEQALPRLAQRVINKIDNTLCGIGLARQKSPVEVVALYATYGYLGSGAYGIDAFVRIYWRFDGVEDRRLTIGHQLVLAALFNKPWTGDDRRWPAIEQRARHALELLIAAGLLDERERQKVAKQIARAKPYSKTELARAKQPRRLPRAPASMAYPIYRATREAEQTFGRDWRTKVAQLDLTVDLTRQRAALRASDAALGRGLASRGAKVTLAIVNERGEYLALHTGDDQFDESDRVRAQRSPGSVTKLLVAAGLARRYGAPNRSELGDAQEALRRSSPSFYVLANQLGVDRGYVDALIECYGDGHHGARDDVIEDAAKGALEASPAQLLAILQDAHFGPSGALPDPHVVLRFVLRDGSERVQATTPSWERRRCAELIYNDGDSYAWFEIPMRGTMTAARKRVDAGKTGSVGRSSDADAANEDVNYWTLALGGRAVGGGYETGIVVLGADAFFDASGNDLSIVGLEQASRSAVPLLAQIMTRPSASKR